MERSGGARWTELVSELPRPLGDGLLLRTARPSDEQELAEFNAAMHADEGLSGDELAEWTLELFQVPYPGFRVEDDVFIVEDTARKRIVSSTCLIPQVWSHAGVTMPVGQPELVATHPDHRRHGLVRRQFEVLHARSAALGHRWQLIAGIPWYYRRFGYSYALDLRSAPTCWLADQPAAGDPAVRIRAATVADAAFLAGVEAEALRQPVLGCRRGEDGWRYELSRRSGALTAGRVLVLEQAGGEGGDAARLGYAVHSLRPRDGRVALRAFELLPGHGWLGPTTSVLAELDRWVREHSADGGRAIRLVLPTGHPALRCAANRLGRGPGGSYGFYVRIPDVPAFLLALAPVLEARIATSPVVGLSGPVLIDLYTSALCLSFEAGRLLAVEARPALPEEAKADAALPVEALLHLLLGNRSVADVEATTPDCELRSDLGAVVLDVLFPPLPLAPWPLA